MADQREIEIKLLWEDNNYCELQAKVDGGEMIQIVKMAENAHLLNVWEHFEAICMDYMKKALATAHTEIGA